MSYMKFSIRHIYVVLLASLLGIYLLMPKADAAGQCAGVMCVHCTEMIFPVNEAATTDGLNDRLCDVSLGNFPCNPDKHSSLNASVVIPLSSNSYRRVSGILLGFAAYNSSLYRHVGENEKAARFHISSATIPIYLQNLSLLC
jgi:hypothetical protein